MANKIVLIGRLTNDVELSELNNDKKTEKAVFTIAVKRVGAKEGQQEADFFRVEALGKNASNISKYVKKGHKIYVAGEMHLDRVKREISGEVSYTTYPKVILEDVEFLENKEK